MAAVTPYGFLCVADLAKYCSEEELVQLFHAFGPIVSVKIIQRTENSSTGLVTLPTFEAAEAAKLRLDGYVFMGKKIRISWANTAVPTPISSSNNVINSIYIRYNARKLDRLIRVEDLERIFAPFGFMTEVCIKDSHMDHRTGRQSGLAFVHFCSSKEGMHAAFRTVSGIDGNTVENIAFRAELSRNLLKQFDQAGMESSSECASVPTAVAFAPLNAASGARSTSSISGSTGLFAEIGLPQSTYYPHRAPALAQEVPLRSHGQFASAPPQAPYGSRALCASAGYGHPEYAPYRMHQYQHQYQQHQQLQHQQLQHQQLQHQQLQQQQLQHQQLQHQQLQHQQLQHQQHQLFPSMTSAGLSGLGGLGMSQQAHRPSFAHNPEPAPPVSSHGGICRPISFHSGDDAFSQLLPAPTAFANPFVSSFDESAHSMVSSSLSPAFDLPVSSTSFSSSSGSFRVEGRSKQFSGILDSFLQGGNGGSNGDSPAIVRDDSWSLRDESSEPCVGQSSWDAIFQGSDTAPQPPASAGFSFF